MAHPSSNLGLRDVEIRTYKGNQPKHTAELLAWHAAATHEEALEPDLLIIDPHHHLYEAPAQGDRYLLPDLLNDTGGGHNIAATVYVEAYRSMWRPSGPPEMRPVGEVEFAAGVSAMASSGIYGPCRVAAAIVASADLALGERAEGVLHAHLAASGGRLRGIRHHAAYDDGVIGSLIKHKAPKHLLLDDQFRKGFSRLSHLGLSFDAWVYHTQLAEVENLAARFPDTTIILNHVGGVLGVANFQDGRDDIFAHWRDRMATLSRRENVAVKVGGMGMAVFGFGFEQRKRPASSADLVRAWKPYIDVCIDLFGPERCMFESNFPVDKQSCGYTELWNAFKLATATLSTDERQALFNGTASRVYQIEGFQ
jgi:L-fuconolactonase